MSETQFFHIALPIFLWSPLLVLGTLLLTNIKAPYGKHTSSIWGSATVPGKWGWILMEAPSSLIFLGFLIFYGKQLNSSVVVLFFVWQFHYFYRSFIYPIKANHSKPMPIALMFSALGFQLVNTYFQASWVFKYAPEGMYGADFLTSWHFILGLFVFLLGSYINRSSDSILRSLRKSGETDYKIPYGGLYQWVSCPNYLGEMIIWLGWSIMLQSWVGFAFFFWTVANLSPRALATHQWYLQKFPEDYPKNRKALFPFII